MTTDIIFYIRQLGHLIQNGASAESALSQITAICPKSQQAIWNDISANYHSSNDISVALSSIKNRQVQILATQLKSAKELKIPEELVLINCGESMSHTAQLAQIAKSRLIKILGYSAWLSSVALGVMAVFVIYVWPAFESTVMDDIKMSADFTARIDMLTFNSLASILLYAPPMLLIILFVYLYFTSIEKILTNPFYQKIPLLSGIHKQLLKVSFIRNLSNFSHYLSDDESERTQQLQSPFFTGSDINSLNALFNQNARQTLLSLFKINTFKNESPRLITEVESNSIEAISRKVGTFSTALHLFIIFIVANIVFAMYLPIFQLGSGF